jgi:hypothetical protein
MNKRMNIKINLFLKHPVHSEQVSFEKTYVEISFFFPKSSKTNYVNAIF